MNLTKLPFLVASNLSARANSALVRAVVLANRCTASLRIVHVAAPDLHERRRIDAMLAGSGATIETVNEVAAMLQEDLQEALAQVGGDAPTHSLAVRWGEPFWEILEEAREAEASLIIVGAHAHDSIVDNLVGTTAERIVRKGDRPVLVVKRHSAIPYRRVLVATDFSDHAERALALAAALVRDAEFHLLHVSGSPGQPPVDSERNRRPDQPPVQPSPDNGPAERLAGMARQAAIPAERIRCHRIGGHPGRAILRQAQTLDADLVVVGSRGLNRFPQILLGTVSQHVLRESECDVLVVR